MGGGGERVIIGGMAGCEAMMVLAWSRTDQKVAVPGVERVRDACALRSVDDTVCNLLGIKQVSERTVYQRAVCTVGKL